MNNKKLFRPVRCVDNVLHGLRERAKKPDSNISLLLECAFYRGLKIGKELAIRKAIEAIEQEIQ